MRKSPHSRHSSAVGWLSALFLSASLLAEQPPSLPEQGSLVVQLQDRRINESSGLCLSRRDPSLFWTLNDSGGEPCVFAIDAQGKTRVKLRVKNAANLDWEDLASGPDEDGLPALFVADIGDNLSIRPSIQIYQFSEPVLTGKEPPDKELESTIPRVWHAAYPDAPHNAESLLVHPKTGRMYVITKSEEGQSAVYAFPAKWPGVNGVTLEKVADLHFPPQARLGKRPRDASMTTGASFAPDGRHLVISTYSYLHEWSCKPGEDLAATFLRPAVQILPLLVPQLEGICYDADARSLWFTSERLPAPLYRIRR